MRAMSVESTRAANAGVDTYKCKYCGKKVYVGFWGWLIGKANYYPFASSLPYYCTNSKCDQPFPWKKV